LLDNKNRLLRMVLASLGSLTSSVVHPREIYRHVIKEAAAAVISRTITVWGSHSEQEDVEITRRLREVADLVGSACSTTSSSARAATCPSSTTVLVIQIPQAKGCSDGQATTSSPHTCEFIEYVWWRMHEPVANRFFDPHARDHVVNANLQHKEGAFFGSLSLRAVRRSWRLIYCAALLRGRGRESGLIHPRRDVPQGDTPVVLSFDLMCSLPRATKRMLDSDPRVDRPSHGRSVISAVVLGSLPWPTALRKSQAILHRL